MPQHGHVSSVSRVTLASNNKLARQSSGVMDLVSLYLETYDRLTNLVTHHQRLPEYHQHHQTSCIIWTGESFFISEPAWGHGECSSPPWYIYIIFVFSDLHTMNNKEWSLAFIKISFRYFLEGNVSVEGGDGAVSEYYPDHPSFKGYTFPLQIGEVWTDYCDNVKHKNI